MNQRRRDDEPDDDHDPPVKIEVELNINHRDPGGSEHIAKMLEQILRATLSLEKRIMTTSAQFTAGFARIDAATTLIAERLRSLSTNIGSMTADEEEAAKTQLDSLATTLEAMATDTDNPVPVEVPPEEPMP